MNSNARKCLAWGLTRGEIETHALCALWQTILYRDEAGSDLTRPLSEGIAPGKHPIPRVYSPLLSPHAV